MKHVSCWMVTISMSVSIVLMSIFLLCKEPADPFAGSGRDDGRCDGISYDHTDRNTIYDGV